MTMIILVCLVIEFRQSSRAIMLPRENKPGWCSWLRTPAGCLVLPVHNRCCAQESLPSPEAPPGAGRLDGGA